MTTSVRVDSPYVGWDVEVILLENGINGNFLSGYSNIRREIIPGGTSKTYHIHDNLEIKSIRELKKTEKIG